MKTQLQLPFNLNSSSPHVEETGAWKLDTDKLAIDLVFPEAIEEIALVFTYGAKKYGRGNWDKGMHWGRLYAATMRHLLAWWRGEELDKESGLPHLSHAASNLCTLIYYSKRNKGTDDRNV